MTQLSANAVATVLLAHGSSDPNWQKPFELLTAGICERAGDDARIELSYMELSEPTLETTVSRLAEEGYQRIDVLPLFFAAGRHLRKDVPSQIEALQKQHLVTITLHPPVGLEPEVATALSDVVLRKTHG